jgi:hypothetical protein
MAKRTGPEKKKKKRTEPHMIVRDLPEGLREVTVDGHTWIEGPYTPAPPAPEDDNAEPSPERHPPPD